MKTFIALAAITLMTACTETDPVPQVEDTKNISVAGVAMTHKEFLDKYCAGKNDHPTCVKVHQAMIADSTKSKTGPVRF